MQIWMYEERDSRTTRQKITQDDWHDIKINLTFFLTHFFTLSRSFALCLSLSFLISLSKNIALSWFVRKMLMIVSFKDEN